MLTIAQVLEAIDEKAVKDSFVYIKRTGCSVRDIYTDKHLHLTITRLPDNDVVACASYYNAGSVLYIDFSPEDPMDTEEIIRDVFVNGDSPLCQVYTRIITVK